MRTQWKRVVLSGVMLLCGVLTLAAAAQEGGEAKEAKKRKRPPMSKVRGTVKEAHAETKSLVVTTEEGDQTFVLTQNVRITLIGPILDGIQPDDQVEVMLKGEEGAKEAIRVTVKREGVSPGRQKKAKKHGGKKKGGEGDAGGEGGDA